MISTQQLLVLMCGLAAGFLFLIVLAIAGWAGRKVYLLLTEINNSLNLLCSKTSAIEQLPGMIDKFSQYTDNHARAALKNALAVDAFSKVVGVLSNTLFKTEPQENTFRVPSEGEVDKRWQIDEMLRGNPGMKEEEAEAHVISQIGAE